MLALTLLLGASACSSDDNADPPNTTVAPTAAPTSATAPATTTTEPKSEEDEVAEAYLEAKAAYYQSGQDPSSADQVLSEFYEGAALRSAVAIRGEQSADGVVTRFVGGNQPVPEILSVSINGDNATIQICLVDDVQQVVERSEEVVDDSVVSRRQTAEVRLLGGRWVVTDGTTISAWNDNKGCDR